MFNHFNFPSARLSPIIERFTFIYDRKEELSIDDIWGNLYGNISKTENKMKNLLHQTHNAVILKYKNPIVNSYDLDLDDIYISNLIDEVS